MNTSRSTGEDEIPEELMGEESEEEPTGEMEKITRGRERGRGEGEGEKEGEEEEEGGAKDEEDNQLLWTNLTRTKVGIEAEM